MSQAQLSEKARELIKKARIVSFSGWQDSHSSEVIECFQKADDQGLYLTDQDLEIIWQSTNPELVLLVKQLRDRSGEIVDGARSQVLQSFPNITQIGGGLYPPVRAEACWRDFWHFLRCITYGIAGQRTDYTSAKGLEYMQLLYKELDVPLDAMVTGLESIKAICLSQVKPEQSEFLAPYFNHLIAALKQFQ